MYGRRHVTMISRGVGVTSECGAESRRTCENLPMGKRCASKRWRRLERWQVLLAAVATALGAIVVAVINLSSGQPQDPPSPTVSTSGSPSPKAAANGSLLNSPVVLITGLSEQPSSPPPGRLYVWNGVERNLPSYASVLVIGELSGARAAVSRASTGGQPWLVSPRAIISKNGEWTVAWLIRKPPSAVVWSAVVQIPSYVQISDCPSTNTSTPDACIQGGDVEIFDPPYKLSSQGLRAPGVIATAPYQPVKRQLR